MWLHTSWLPTRLSIERTLSRDQALAYEIVDEIGREMALKDPHHEGFKQVADTDLSQKAMFYRAVVEY